MVVRDFDPATDREAVRRIWREVGWTTPDKEVCVDRYVQVGTAMVAEVHGEAECCVISAPGTMRFLQEEIPLSAVTGVTTSRVARKMGMAAKLAARVVAHDAAHGAMVSALGMFEQGFYNQIGFGTGSYERSVSFDPSDLRTPPKLRAPRRLTPADALQAHQARLARFAWHGRCNLTSSDVTVIEMEGSENGFGLGYFDGPAGELTHFLWGRTNSVESGPYTIDLVYRDGRDLIELLALIRSLGDQVRAVRMREPALIQMQDLLHEPFKNRMLSEKGRFQAEMRSTAYWQARICNVEGCIERTHLPYGSASFHLRLTDPIAAALDSDAPWHGVSGDYTVFLGEVSRAEHGIDPTLPTMEASVGAFTRLWLGVRSASSLAVTDDLHAPDELLRRLDVVLRLPEPHPDWDF